MGNKQSQIQQLEKSASRDYFIIDRVISPTIIIGVTKQKDDTKPLSRQGIRYANHGPIYRLENVREYSNCLEYTFEEDVQLTLCKINENVMLTLKTQKDGVFVKPVDERIRKFYKPISMASEELDRIQTIMK